VVVAMPWHEHVHIIVHSYQQLASSPKYLRPPAHSLSHRPALPAAVTTCTSPPAPAGLLSCSSPAVLRLTPCTGWTSRGWRGRDCQNLTRTELQPTSSSMIPENVPWGRWRWAL